MSNVHKVSASLVVVDEKAAAILRDKLAREQLSDNVPEQRTLHVLKGLRMTLPYTLKLVVNTKENDDSKLIAGEILEECFKITDNILNNFNPESEISKINASEAVDCPIKISPVLVNVLFCAFEVTRTSGGGFDPAYLPVSEWLKQHPNRPLQENEKKEMKEIMKYSSFLNAWRLDKENGTITKLHPKAKFDLGGISKGYTVDNVVETLKAKGFPNVFFDWSGDCRGCGIGANGGPWAVGIIRPPALEDLSKPPAEEPQFLRVVTLDNESLATSGDYENLSMITDGKGRKVVITTIFNIDIEDFLRPSADHIAQVSIKNTKCMYADALATASLNKRFQVRVRTMLEYWRYARHNVLDYTTYIRNGEKMAKMHEIAKETEEMRAKRMSLSLPARVIVVGGGLAGLSAAVEAANCNANVILMEKTEKVGGNSAKATSGINGWGTQAQGAYGIQDDGKYFERDTFLSGKGGYCDTNLVKVLSVKSRDAISWLSKNFNLPLTVVSQLGGHSKPRTHRAPDLSDGTPVPIGYTIMKHLENAVANNPRITIMRNTNVVSLINYTKSKPDGSIDIFVTGVKYRPEGESPDKDPYSLLADSVVLATGGFGNDRTDNSLLREYAPGLITKPSTNGSFATGDGVKMARQIGAMLIDMDKIQLHPTGLIDPKDPINTTKYLGPEALRGSGGILINSRGLRFVNELDLRSVVSKAITSQGDVYPNSNGAYFAYCVLNEAAVKLFGKNSIGFYANRLGLFKHAENVDELASIIGCPKMTLIKTLKDYEANSKSNEPCSVTNKSVFPCVFGPEGSFYVGIVTPTIHYTMGGALINSSAEIVSNHKAHGVFGSRHPIYGLYGAGEVTGGVHGKNRLGGNSLLECVVFGRIAGDRAATILQKKSTALSFTDWTNVVLREVREGTGFGYGCRILRFNLPGARQSSGLKLGQFIAIRGEWDGQQLIGYYSPITLPDDLGVIGILCRVDKGTLKDWIGALRPGDSVEMKGFGGLCIERIPSTGIFEFHNAPIRQIGMIAGGTGIAPMLQILRAALKVPYIDNLTSLRLIYAAEEVEELTYREILENFEITSKNRFKCRFVVNKPPPGWTNGVGYIDKVVLTRYIQRPSPDLLIVICGPPIMQRIVKNTLFTLGHHHSRVRTVDEVDSIKSKL